MWIHWRLCSSFCLFFLSMCIIIPAISILPQLLIDLRSVLMYQCLIPLRYQENNGFEISLNRAFGFVSFIEIHRASFRGWLHFLIVSELELWGN